MYQLKWCTYGKFPWWPCLVIDPSITTIPHVAESWHSVERQLAEGKVDDPKVQTFLSKAWVLFLGSRDWCVFSRFAVFHGISHSCDRHGSALVDLNWRLSEWDNQCEEKKRCMNSNGKKISKPNKFEAALIEADVSVQVLRPSSHPSQAASPVPCHLSPVPCPLHPAQHFLSLREPDRLRLIDDYFCPPPVQLAPPGPKSKPKKKEKSSKSSQKPKRASSSVTGSDRGSSPSSSKRQRVQVPVLTQDISLRLRGL